MKGYLLGNDVLVWSAEGKLHDGICVSFIPPFISAAIEWLNANWRIVGGLMGALPQSPRQNVQLGLPLLLLPEQVALLLNKGWRSIVICMIITCTIIIGILDIYRAQDCDPTHSDPIHVHRDVTQVK